MQVPTQARSFFAAHTESLCYFRNGNDCFHPQTALMRPIRTALAAYGMSGQVFHAPVLSVLPQYALTHIAQRRGATAQARYPAVGVLSAYDDLLVLLDVELVVVNTPEATHYDLARRAIEAGKHVVVEKAFTPTLAEALDLVALADRRGVVLSVYQNRRWDSDFRTVAAVLREGSLGRLVSYEAHYDRYRSHIQEGVWKEDPAPGTGILYNLGSHLIDQALHLFGPPERLWADLRTERRGGRVPDAFDLVLYYPGPLRVRLRAGYLVREAGPRFVLHGEQGSFVKYGIDPQEEALKQGLLPEGPGWGAEPADMQGWLHDAAGRRAIPSLPGDYRLYYEALYRCIREGAPNPVPPMQAATTIALIERAAESHAQGRVLPFAWDRDAS
ncbi:MAG: Gfo/Idh/MocA family oxidoreductase [Bacteroidia bacterium]